MEGWERRIHSLVEEFLSIDQTNLGLHGFFIDT